jgi:hypothetical protein
MQLADTLYWSLQELLWMIHHGMMLYGNLWQSNMAIEHP